MFNFKISKHEVKFAMESNLIQHIGNVLSVNIIRQVDLKLDSRHFYKFYLQSRPENKFKLSGTVMIEHFWFISERNFMHTQPCNLKTSRRTLNHSSIFLYSVFFSVRQSVIFISNINNLAT